MTALPTSCARPAWGGKSSPPSSSSGCGRSSASWNEAAGMKLLQMSLAGGVMILVITVIRALAIERLPKKTFLAL